MGSTDNELMLRCHHGDASAFEEIVRRWENRVAAVVARLVDSRSDVEDLCQEVFLRVYGARRRYRANGMFSPWLFAIVKNVARDAHRRNGAFRELLEARRRQVAGVTAPTDDGLEEAERRQRIDQAIARLPAKLREPLVLKHFGGLSFTDVARVAHLPVSTAKSRVRVALEELRKELGNQGLQREDL